VASVDNEATVKRFYLQKPAKGSDEVPQVELRPANPRLKSMWYPANEVEIRGLVVGLIRRY
jgi:repressor LexA